jgi:hypothetical protein
MKIPSAPFGRVNWSAVESVEFPGERGFAVWRTRILGDIRLRMVDYSPGYLADHWCTKGHVLLCVSGSLSTRLGNGRVIDLSPGESYDVGDESEPHRSSTNTGATLFIVD